MRLDAKRRASNQHDASETLFRELGDVSDSGENRLETIEQTQPVVAQ